MYVSNFRKTKIHNLNVFDLNFSYNGPMYQNLKCIYQSYSQIEIIIWLNYYFWGNVEFYFCSDQEVHRM